MSRFLAAVLASFVLHALVALAFRSRLIGDGRNRERSVRLEVSSIELSDAETVDETARPKHPVASTAAVSGPRPEPSESVRDDGVLPAETPPEVVVAVADIRPAEEASRVESPAPRQGRIDAPARLRCAIRSEYPRGARARGEAGTVMLEAVVSERGSVDSVRVTVSSGFGELDRAAERAVRAATFEPATRDGSPVAATVVIPVVFRLK